MTEATAAKYKVPEIYKSIAAIQKDIGGIKKNGVGPAAKGSFPYVKNDDILDAVHDLLVKHNVIVKPFLELDHTVDTSGTRTFLSAKVKLMNTYISTIDGSEYQVVTVGEGSDIGSDTATRKAVTQASKIANLLTFSIATGESAYDEEGVDRPEPAKTAAPVQRATPPTKVQAAEGGGVDKLVANVKAVGIKKGLSIAELNARGKEIHANFIADAPSLNQLLKVISDLPDVQ